MGRPPQFTTDELLDASRTVLLQSGPAAFSLTAVADFAAAPSGSLYHRFSGRDVLLASLWLRAVERFQAGLLEALAEPDAFLAARGAARYVVRWSREHVEDARLLLLYRSDDLLREGWPADVRARNAAQQRGLETAMSALYERLGARDRAARRRVRFAIMAIPYGAVRGPLGAGRRPEVFLEDLVDEAASAVLAALHPRKEMQ